jgi:hypothetical protein
MSESIKLLSVALDCPDAGQLAAFYAGITGGEVIFCDDSWAVVQAPGARIDFQTAAGYVPPAWPDPDPPARRAHFGRTPDGPPWSPPC